MDIVALTLLTVIKILIAELRDVSWSRRKRDLSFGSAPKTAFAESLLVLLSVGTLTVDFTFDSILIMDYEREIRAQAIFDALCEKLESNDLETTEEDFTDSGMPEIDDERLPRVVAALRGNTVVQHLKIILYFYQSKEAVESFRVLAEYVGTSCNLRTLEVHSQSRSCDQPVRLLLEAATSNAFISKRTLCFVSRQRNRLRRRFNGPFLASTLLMEQNKMRIDKLVLRNPRIARVVFAPPISNLEELWVEFTLEEELSVSNFLRQLCGNGNEILVSLKRLSFVSRSRCLGACWGRPDPDSLEALIQALCLLLNSAPNLAEFWFDVHFQPSEAHHMCALWNALGQHPSVRVCRFDTYGSRLGGPMLEQLVLCLRENRQLEQFSGSFQSLAAISTFLDIFAEDRNLRLRRLSMYTSKIHDHFASFYEQFGQKISRCRTLQQLELHSLSPHMDSHHPPPPIPVVFVNGFRMNQSLTFVDIGWINYDWESRVNLIVEEDDDERNEDEDVPQIGVDEEMIPVPHILAAEALDLEHQPVDGSDHASYETISYKDAKRVIRFCCIRNEFRLELLAAAPMTQEAFLSRLPELVEETAQFIGEDFEDHLSVIYETTKAAVPLLFPSG